MSVVFYLSGLSLITLGPPCSINSSSSRIWQIESIASSSLASLSSTEAVLLSLFLSIYAVYVSCFSLSLRLLHQPSSRLVIATYLLPLDITLVFRSVILLSTHSYIVLAPYPVYLLTSLSGVSVTDYLSAIASFSLFCIFRSCFPLFEANAMWLTLAIIRLV